MNTDDPLPNPFAPPAEGDTFSGEGQAGAGAAENEPGTPSTVRPFTMWAPSQFLTYQTDPSAALLGDGFVEKGEWTSVVGVGGLGKTRLVLWLLICQMLGRMWCGLKTGGSPQKAAIFSTENGLRRWKSDLEKLLTPLAEAERAVVEANLRILALTPDEEGDLCLGNLETRARLKVTLDGLKPGIAVFDPMADMIDGDESKTPDMVATLRHLRIIVRPACPDAAVIVVHHARTGSANVKMAGSLFEAGNFGRGSKALYSRVRCELQLAPASRDDANRLVLACGKANNCEKFKPRGINFDPQTYQYAVDPSFDYDRWLEDVDGKRRDQELSVADVVRVVEELAPAGAETATGEIAARLVSDDVSRRTIDRRLQEAEEGGYLASPRKGKWKLGARRLKS